MSAQIIDGKAIAAQINAETREIIASLKAQGKETALPTLTDALNSLQISFAMIESSETGTVITL